MARKSPVRKHRMLMFAVCTAYKISPRLVVRLILKSGRPSEYSPLRLAV